MYYIEWHTLAEKGWVSRGHAGILEDGVEGAGGLDWATLGGAGQKDHAAKVDRPQVQTQPVFVPVLQVSIWQ